MAEIGIAAEIITVLNLSAKLTSLSYLYLSASQDVHAQVSALRSESLNLETLLLELQKVELTSDNDGISIRGNGSLGKTVLTQWLEECKSEVQRLVHELEGQGSKRERLKQMTAKLVWPLIRHDVDRSAALIERKKAGVGLGIGIENL